MRWFLERIILRLFSIFLNETYCDPLCKTNERSQCFMEKFGKLSFNCLCHPFLSGAINNLLTLALSVRMKRWWVVTYGTK